MGSATSDAGRRVVVRVLGAASFAVGTDVTDLSDRGDASSVSSAVCFFDEWLIVNAMAEIAITAAPAIAGHSQPLLIWMPGVAVPRAAAGG